MAYTDKKKKFGWRTMQKNDLASDCTQIHLGTN